MLANLFNYWSEGKTLVWSEGKILVGCPQNANCFNNASDTFRNTYEWREFPRNHAEE